jgi:cytochrome c553
MTNKIKAVFKIYLLLMVAVCFGTSYAFAAGAEGHWGTSEGEALEALDLIGDGEDGEDLYDICAACHLPEGWGDLAGTFPQLAGQHATVLIKQIADIRAGNRDNPTMYPFAIQIEGAQDLADVSAYIQTLEMNPKPITGPGGPSFVLSNLRKDVSSHSLDSVEKKVGKAAFKKLKTIEETNFNSKKAFITKLKSLLTPADLSKSQAKILGASDWTSDLKLGKKLYEENCVQCHGDHGQGNYKEYYPVIAGQTYLYLVRQFNWIKTGKRRNANPDMVKQINGFSQLDMRSVVDYAGRFVMKEGDWKKIEVTEEEDGDSF